MTTPHHDALIKAADKLENLARIAEVISSDPTDPAGMEYRDAGRLLREWADIPLGQPWTVTNGPDPEPDLAEPFDLGICAYQLRKVYRDHTVRPDPAEHDFRSRDWKPGILRDFRTPRGSDDTTLVLEDEDGTLRTINIPRVSLVIIENITGYNGTLITEI